MTNRHSEQTTYETSNNTCLKGKTETAEATNCSCVEIFLETKYIMLHEIRSFYRLQVSDKLEISTVPATFNEDQPTEKPRLCEPAKTDEVHRG